MAYFCRKCRRWHTSGSIAQRHKIFSAKPNRRSHRPKQPVLHRKRKTKQNKPILTIKKKRKPTRVNVSTKIKKPRKPRNGLSRMRRGQLAMRAGDQYEKNMVKRVRSKTGMTHIQVMNLVNLAKKSDYIDIETEITSASGHSRNKTEVYEYAKNNIIKKLNQQGYIEKQSKYTDSDYYDNMMDEYKHQMEWEKQSQRFRKKYALI